MAFFADPKLELAMIDEVHRRRGEYWWVERHRAAYEATQPKMSWREIEDNTCEHVPELEAFLAALPIERDELRQIENLTLDGDRDLYQWVYPSWWDFGDHFTITDLSGIGQCERLEYLLLGQGLVVRTSLTPLASLARLRELHVCALCEHRDVSAVLEIPALRRLDVVNVSTSPERPAWRSIIGELRARGVEVRAG